LTVHPRLLVLTSTYPRWPDDHEPGFVHQLCKRLTGDFEVTVLCPHAAGAAVEENMDGVHVRRYRYAPARLETLVNDGGITVNLKRRPWKWLLVPGFLLAQMWCMWRLIRNWHPDVIHAHWLIPQGLLTATLSRLERCTPAFVVTAHGADLFALHGRLLDGVKRWVAKSCACMTVVSSAMREEATRIGLKPPRIQVLPMGVDLQRRFVPDARSVRSTHELLFVGRLVSKKGVHYLLEALPRVLARYPLTQLTIAGFGPEETTLKQQVRGLDLERSVNFIGAVEQNALPDLYRRAAVFVAPFIRDASGNQEGLPVTLMEAIGCGCPVVVGEVAGIRDLLNDAASDVCVNPMDSQALAAAICTALDNPLQALARAQSIRQYAFAKVDWQPIAHSYAHILLECAAGSSKRNN
jgi:glycosyltransferase involved in cell wall biosynthesis